MSHITTKEGHGDSPTSVLTDCSSSLLFYYKYLMHGSTMEDRNFSSVNDPLMWIPPFSSVWKHCQKLLWFESEMSLSGSYTGTHGHSLVALIGKVVDPLGGGNLLEEVGHWKVRPSSIQSLLPGLSNVRKWEMSGMCFFFHGVPCHCPPPRWCKSSPAGTKMSPSSLKLLFDKYYFIVKSNLYTSHSKQA